jgi:hypothetical protein
MNKEHGFFERANVQAKADTFWYKIMLQCKKNTGGSQNHAVKFSHNHLVNTAILTNSSNNSSRKSSTRLQKLRHDFHMYI